jgi:DNA-binding response OmpR family regulator
MGAPHGSSCEAVNDCSRLRAKVDDPFETKLIHTIYGVGYVLKAHVSC